jgi:hypothetical protein
LRACSRGRQALTFGHRPPPPTATPRTLLRGRGLGAIASIASIASIADVVDVAKIVGFIGFIGSIYGVGVSGSAQ